MIENIHNIQKTQENTENGRYYVKHQMHTKYWKSNQYTSKSKIEKEWELAK